MPINPWIALYESVDDTMRIQTTPDPGIVIVHFEDGSQNELTYHGGTWVVSGSLNTCPGDVAARDSF